MCVLEVQNKNNDIDETPKPHPRITPSSINALTLN
jgi:hypothetical protein